MVSSDDKITKSNTFDLDPLDEDNEINKAGTFDLDDSKEFDASKERSVTGFSSKTEMAEKIYTSFPLRDILNTDIGFRLFMQHMSSEYSVESLLFLVEIIRYKYAMNGFKHIEMYSTAATSSAISSEIGDELTWYMPLPPSLLDEVVKPPDAELTKSVSIQINEDLVTQPHANIDPNNPDDGQDENQKHQKAQTPKRVRNGDHTFHLSVGKIKNKKERGRTQSNTTKNPLFHVNTNIDIEARQDGTMNELDQWDEAQIAW
eukprot:CAMPEP_0201595950 /NCGR_PEP_ID=MMETSP0190_2-20130828/192786_1 /ASSEMBLY_ACC=CAM_ASM_000263 /TAXON_ID=37353 /ORGANISM="Rosalina sp." /LENGTH=259 /DNA_ID=CAMNT_0048056117 /DNA_START=1210 /DNA_END=1986 /DNA_ORIENTATION=-